MGFLKFIRLYKWLWAVHLICMCFLLAVISKQCIYTLQNYFFTDWAWEQCKEIASESVDKFWLSCSNAATCLFYWTSARIHISKESPMTSACNSNIEPE